MCISAHPKLIYLYKIHANWKSHYLFTKFKAIYCTQNFFTPKTKCKAIHSKIMSFSLTHTHTLDETPMQFNFNAWNLSHSLQNKLTQQQWKNYFLRKKTWQSNFLSAIFFQKNHNKAMSSSRLTLTWLE